MSKLSLIEHLMSALQDSISIIRDRDLKLEDCRDLIELQRQQLQRQQVNADMAAVNVAAPPPATSWSGNTQIGLELLQRSRELSLAASAYWTKTSEHFEKIADPEEGEEDGEIADDLYIPQDLKAFWSSVEAAVEQANDVIRRTDKLVNTGMWSTRESSPPWQVVQMQKDEPEASEPPVELSLVRSYSASLCKTSIRFAREIVEYFAEQQEIGDLEDDRKDAKILPESLRTVYLDFVEVYDETRALIKKKKSRQWPEDALVFDELMGLMPFPDNVRKVKGRNKRIRTMLEVMSHREITDYAYQLQSYLERELRKMERLLESKPLTEGLAKDFISRFKKLRTAWMEQFDTAHGAFIRSAVHAEIGLGLAVCEKAKSFTCAVVSAYDPEPAREEFEDDADPQAVLPPKLYALYADLEEVRTKFLAHSRSKKASNKKK